MPIQFTHTNDWGDASDFADGINWAWNNGADIINISGGTQQSGEVENAINSATSSGRSGKGCIVVKSAGNYGSITYPGTLSNVITVGMTDDNDERISGSGIGAELDVMAPSGVYATDIEGEDGASDFDYIVNTGFTGTSAAAPHVSGLAGLILSTDNTLTEQQVREIIQYTADDLGTEGWDQYCGWGRINAGSAVKSADCQFTTSGQLSHNEYWWDSVTLSGNITVPSGKMLTISSSTTISTNGYIVTCSGTGRITTLGTVNSAVLIKSGEDVKAIYPTIQSALDASTTSQEVVVNPGTYTLTSTLTVASGKTLILKSGVTLEFGNGNALSVYGKLQADGATLKNSTASQWGGVRFYSGSSSESYLSDCTIEKATYGVYIAYSSPLIEDCDIGEGTSKGFYIRYSGAEPTIRGCNVDDVACAMDIGDSADPTVDNNYFRSVNDPYAYTIKVYSSGGTFTRNSITADDDADCVYVGGSTADPVFGGSSGYGNKFEFAYQSLAYIVSGSPSFGEYGSSHWNYFTDNFQDYAIENRTANYLNAYYNYWESGPYAGDFYGNVYYSPYLTYAQIQQVGVGPTWKASSVPDAVENEFYEAFNLYNQKEYSAAVSELRAVFNKYPDHDLAHQALFKLFSSNRKLKSLSTEIDFMRQIINGNYEERCQKVARGWLADYYAKQGDMASAEKTVLLSPEGSLSERELLLDLIYDYTSIGDAENANRIAEIMKARHEDKDVEKDIAIAMEFDEDLDKETPDVAEETVSEETLLANSPNPFNSSTVINYYVKSAGLVELTIYNVLGQEVRSLVNTNQEIGHYTVQWNGTNHNGNVVPSGIYLVHLKTWDNSRTLKISLMK